MDVFHTDSYLKCSEVACNRYIASNLVIETLRDFILNTFGQASSPATATQDSETRYADGEAFSVFEAAWTNEQPFGDTSWLELRGEMMGAYDGRVPNWLFAIRRQSIEDEDPHKLASPCLDILRGMVAREPQLAGASYGIEPWKGATLLHQACAAGDVELVELLTQNKDTLGHLGPQGLESRMAGTFLRECPPSLEALHELSVPHRRTMGQTPLEIALIACRDDEASKQIVRALVRAGAQLVYREGGEASGRVLYTVLHVLGRSRWQHDNLMTHPQDMSEERLQDFLHHFVHPAGDLHGKVDPDERNLHDYTGLQVAAMMGNSAFFVTMMELRQLEIWRWGRKREVAFALNDIESGEDEHRVSALDLAIVFKRFNIMRLGISAAIINEKWRRFARNRMLGTVTFQVVVAFFTAVVCLDDSTTYSALRVYSRLIVVVLCVGFVTVQFLTWFMCAKSQPFFKHLSYNPFANDRINIWSLLMFRNFLQVVIMCCLALTAPWTTPEAFHAAHYAFWWHVSASLWWLILIHLSIRYFELFETTVQLAAALPQIMKKDVVPFGCFFLVVFLASGVSLRVSVTGSETANDSTAGTFLRTLWTLEEAIHGPDARWRPMVEEHPLLTSCIFIAFLWIMLAMVSLLIGMFSNRFDETRKHTNDLYLFHRAQWTVTIEKLIPDWYYRYADLRLGVTLGVSPFQHTGKKAAMRRLLPSNRHGDSVTEHPSRWFVWRGGTQQHFDKWKQQVEHTSYFTI